MNFLDALASSIATAEGYFAAGSLPLKLSNPGDLLFAGQPFAVPHPVTGKDGKVRTFAQFAGHPQGIVALYRQILARVAQGYSLRKLICDARSASSSGPAGRVLQWRRESDFVKEKMT